MQLLYSVWQKECIRFHKQVVIDILFNVRKACPDGNSNAADVKHMSRGYLQEITANCS